MENEVVTFTDVLNADNTKCRVEHKIIEEQIGFYCSFDSFQSVLELLSKYCDSSELREIIKNGKWYLK